MKKLYSTTSLIMFDSSTAQEKLAIWLVVVIRIAAAVGFLASFCAFWMIAVDIIDVLVEVH